MATETTAATSNESITQVKYDTSINYQEQQVKQHDNRVMSALC